VMAEELNVVVAEVTFRLLKGKTDLLQRFQYQRAMFEVLVESLREYHDVVDIREGEVPSIVAEDGVHGSLKVSGSVLQTKRHANIFPESVFGNEGGEQSCSRGQSELVVTFVTVQCREEHCAPD